MESYHTVLHSLFQDLETLREDNLRLRAQAGAEQEYCRALIEELCYPVHQSWTLRQRGRAQRDHNTGKARLPR